RHHSPPDGPAPHVFALRAGLHPHRPDVEATHGGLLRHRPSVYAARARRPHRQHRAADPRRAFLRPLPRVPPRRRGRDQAAHPHRKRPERSAPPRTHRRTPEHLRHDQHGGVCVATEPRRHLGAHPHPPHAAHHQRTDADGVLGLSAFGCWLSAITRFASLIGSACVICFASLVLFHTVVSQQETCDLPT